MVSRRRGNRCPTQRVRCVSYHPPPPRAMHIACRGDALGYAQIFGVEAMLHAAFASGRSGCPAVATPPDQSP